MISVYFERRRAFANGVAIAGESIGQLVLPLLLEFLFNEYSLRGTLLIMGAMFFNIVISGALFRPLSFYTKRNMEKDDGSCEDAFIKINDNMSVLEDTEIDSNKLTQLSSVSSESGDIDYEQQLHDSSIAISTSGFSNTMTDDVNGRMIDPLSNKPLLIHENRLNNHDDVKADVSGCCTKCRRKCTCDNIRKCNCDNLSIFRHYPFVYFMSSSLIACGILYSATIFLPIHSGVIQEDKYKIASLLSISGAMDLIGRVGSGFLADFKLVETVYLSAICLMMAGINCIILAFADEYWWILIHTVILGLFSGAMPTLMITTLVELVGVEHLPKAFSVLLVSQQIVTAAIQPFLGWLRDSHDTTTILFLVVGILTLVPACFMLLTPKLKRRYDRSQTNNILNTRMDAQSDAATEVDI